MFRGGARFPVEQKYKLVSNLSKGVRVFCWIPVEVEIVGHLIISGGSLSFASFGKSSKNQPPPSLVLAYQAVYVNFWVDQKASFWSSQISKHFLQPSLFYIFAKYWSERCWFYTVIMSHIAVCVCVCVRVCACARVRVCWASSDMQWTRQLLGKSSCE